MYISPITFQIPTNLIKLVSSIQPISFLLDDTKSRNPIYRQLNQLIISGKQINDQIQLHDHEHNETLIVTTELLEKLKHRYKALVSKWNVEYTPFREQEIPELIQTKIKSYLPENLQKLNPQVAIQSKSEKQGIIPPHTDHYRTASLFFLLKGNNEETIWWEPTDTFEEFNFYRFADVTKIEKAHTEIIAEHQWYVFNNSKYHSVHPTGINGRRTALCIEFNNLSADDLYALINNNAN